MPAVGQRLSFNGAVCTVRYVGEVAGTNGSWLGVEWDDPTRGKHDGQHKGVRYFTCKSKSCTAASFVRPTRPAEAPLSFIAALHQKYAANTQQDGSAAHTGPATPQIVISGKVVEEVGFDKVRRKLAQLSELKIVILDGARVVTARDEADGEARIVEICPKVTELDLSRNLFKGIGTIVDICRELEHLKSLRLNGNRLQHVMDDSSLDGAERVFHGVKELELEETCMEWPEIFHVASRFPSLTSLFASGNQLRSLAQIPPSSITSTLVSLHLEYNEFTSLSDVAPLASIGSLRNLHLKGNRISEIAGGPAPPPIFQKALTYLDISNNQVSSWSFVDELVTSFPGLTSLRFAHNPIYDNPELDILAPNHPNETSTTTQAAHSPTGNPSATAPTTDEAYMLLLARLPSLRVLNFSTITPADRSNAEMFYLSRIARQLSGVPENSDDEARVLGRHRRWAELCELYGEPAVVRRKEVDPNFLEARLITVQLHLRNGDGVETTSEAAESDERQTQSEESSQQHRLTKIPKSFDIYAVKGIVGKLFGLPPLKLRLVWETGEWDPVAGFEEEAGDSSDEEELEYEREKREEDGSARLEADSSQAGRNGGRWVKREVELRDGPRQFGYCVDGLEVRIRVEVR